MNPKLNFLRNDLPTKLKKIDPDKKGLWGKMNVQQMVEHMTDSIREANGKIPRNLVTAPERLAAMREFILSEKEFRPGTKNSLMGEEPDPVKRPSINEAIADLEKELHDFEMHYNANPGLKIMNPFFGELNFEEWTHLLHKHAVHHLKQFGV